IHAAPNTTSNIFAKSISKDGGRSSYRGLLEVAKGAHGARSKVVCDALLLDEASRSDTYPTIRIGEDDVNVGHEATVSKVGAEQLFADLDAAGDYGEAIVMPLDEAARQHPDLVDRHLGTAVSSDDPFVARNEAALGAGAFVYVPRGVSVPAPVLLTAVQSRP